MKNTKPNDKKERKLIPISSKWLETIFYVILLIWVLYLLSEVSGYTTFEDYLAPYLFITIMCSLIIIKIGSIFFPDIYKKYTITDNDSPTDHVKNQVEERNAQNIRTGDLRTKYEMKMVLWASILPFLMYGLGMGWAIIIFVFSFSLYFLQKIKTAILITVIIAIFMTVLFIQILNIRLWTGLHDFPDPLVYLGEIISMFL